MDYVYTISIQILCQDNYFKYFHTIQNILLSIMFNFLNIMRNFVTHLRPAGAKVLARLNAGGSIIHAGFPRSTGPLI